MPCPLYIFALLVQLHLLHGYFCPTSMLIKRKSHFDHSYHSSTHSVELEYPTGLFVVSVSSIIERARKQNIHLPSLSTDDSEAYLCILHHDCIAIRPQFMQVHQENDVLSPSHCQEIIMKAEAYALEHGWTEKRHTGYPTTDLPIGSFRFFLCR